MAITGKRVQWTSQANGSETTKEGVVLGVIPVRLVPSTLFPFLNDISPSSDKLGTGVHGTSFNTRVLIRVDRIGSKGQPLTPWYYAPSVSKIYIVEG